MERSTTARGFGIYTFTDNNGNESSIQESSSAIEAKIWVGCSDIGLKEFVAGRQPSAWEDITLDDTMDHHWVANNRMHLTQKQVEEMLPILQKFVETGEI